MKTRVVLLKQYHENPEEALSLESIDGPHLDPKKGEVLIEVYAASLNPIDTRIRAGYGRSIFGAKASLPLVLGRDFSGVVVKLGEDVADYKEGDSVFGVVSPFRSEGMKYGSHSQFVCVPVSEITKKPANLSHIEAASLPYVALTTYTALMGQTGLQCHDYKSKRVFVHAGAGGVGSYAIQFLKALGAYVITTCSTSNVDYVLSLGADEVVDYKKDDYAKKIKDCDIAYDLLGKAHTDPTLSLLKSNPPSSDVVSKIKTLLTSCQAQLVTADESWSIPKYKNILKSFDETLATLLALSASPKYVSIVGPMMPLTDQKGLHPGMVQFISDALQKKADQAMQHGRCFNYSVFEPNQAALQLLAEHITAGKVKPSVGHVFSLDQASAAHREMQTGHTRGKIVFSMSQ